MVSVKYRSCLVARYDHRNSLRNSSQYHISNRCSAQIVKQLSLEPNALASLLPSLPRNLSKSFSPAVTHPSTSGVASQRFLLVVLRLKLGQGKLAMGNVGDSAKSVHNDRNGRQQGTSEERIRLVVPRLLIGHESSKPPEFSVEWMVNQAQQVARKLSGAVHESWSIIFVSNDPAIGEFVDRRVLLG
jgi:hypothetical protein